MQLYSEILFQMSGSFFILSGGLQQYPVFILVYAAGIMLLFPDATQRQECNAIAFQYPFLCLGRTITDMGVGYVHIDGLFMRFDHGQRLEKDRPGHLTDGQPG